MSNTRGTVALEKYLLQSQIGDYLFRSVRIYVIRSGVSAGTIPYDVLNVNDDDDGWNVSFLCVTQGVCLATLSRSEGIRAMHFFLFRITFYNPIGISMYFGFPKQTRCWAIYISLEKRRIHRSGVYDYIRQMSCQMVVLPMIPTFGRQLQVNRYF